MAYWSDQVIKAWMTEGKIDDEQQDDPYKKETLQQATDIEQQDDPSENLLTCTICSETFKHRSIVRHYQNFHKKVPPPLIVQQKEGKAL